MTAQEQGLSGGCGCGAVRYTIAAAPIFTNNCHCRQCQQQTGSTSVVNAFFETEALTILSGRTERHAFRAGSGGDHVIARCAACGTALWSHYPRVGEHGLGVRAGTLDDPGAVRPDAVVWTSERLPWVALPADIPAFDRYYNPADLLPPDRFARLVALVRKKDAESQ